MIKHRHYAKRYTYLALLPLLACSSSLYAQYSTTAETGNWMLNVEGERSVFMLEEAGGRGVLVNVQSVDEKEIDGKLYINVKASGIPNYRTTVDQALLDVLAARPKSTTDFVNGRPDIALGDVVEYGQNIGFRSSTEFCETTGGTGYWPPGPGCPLDVSKSAFFTTEPVFNDEECKTDLGAIGYFANGTSIYDWNDGQSYNREGVWQHTAAVAEIHDLDICLGHAAKGDYHHHNHSACLAEQMGDTGQEHSPVYGTSADGFPVHGPWQAEDTLAISSWLTRDYDNADSLTGCGAVGERSCLLVDLYDATKGTKPASSPGPMTSEFITSMSKNPIPAVSGLYFQDYYHSPELAAEGGAHLDKHNGHEHDDHGYHYHLTVVESNEGIQTPSFPFTFGPTYKGVVDANAVGACSTGTRKGPPPRKKK